LKGGGDRADVSTVFDQQQSEPAGGTRTFTNLQLLLPGAQLLGWSHARMKTRRVPSRSGRRPGFWWNRFELTVPITKIRFWASLSSIPAMDAVTETKITTQNFDAELARPSPQLSPRKPGRHQYLPRQRV